MSEPQMVTAAIIQKEGRILICRRKATGAFPLRWEFPGGKVEPGEEKRQAIVRELKEELGIDASVGGEIFQTSHHYPGGIHIHLTVFRVESFQGDPRNLAFEAICWVRPEKLESFEFLAADRALVQWLGNQEREEG